MSATGPAGASEIDAVLFDLHFTLLDQGDAAEWLAAGWRAAGRPGEPDEGLGSGRIDEVVKLLDEVWTVARTVDPTGQRDLDSAAHREVFAEVLRRGGVEPDLIEGLYLTLWDRWLAYEDAAPTMAALQAAGIKLVVLSNIGVDARPMLARAGLLPFADAIVLSVELGVVKPEPEIFRHALQSVDASAERTLMVGDSIDDAGALAVGIRTLLLPRRPMPTRGLDAVLRVVGI